MIRKLVTAAIIFAVGTMVNAAVGDVVNVNITLGAGNANTVNVDGTGFSPTFAPIEYAGSTFNDIGVGSGAGGSGPAGSDLLDSLGNTTTIGFSFTSNPNSGSNFGFSQTITGSNSQILANYLAINNGFGGGNTANPVTLTFTGLDDSLTYDFSFIATGDNATQGATITIDGTSQATSGSGDAALTENANFVTFNGVSSSGGNLSVGLAAGPGNATFIALSGFQIRAVAVPEPSSLVLLGLGGVAAVVRRRKNK